MSASAELLQQWHLFRTLQHAPSLNLPLTIDILFLFGQMWTLSMQAIKEVQKRIVSKAELDAAEGVRHREIGDGRGASWTYPLQLLSASFGMVHRALPCSSMAAMSLT